jgi:hypothetical protein
MDNIDWENIKVAIWSDGLLTEALIEKLQMRYPGIAIHIRSQVMEGVNRMPSIYAHPDVADFDIGFVNMGDTEQIFIRCVSRHRLFNYRLDTMRENAWRRELFLRFVVDALPGLFGPPSFAEAANSVAEEAEGVNHEHEV